MHPVERTCGLHMKGPPMPDLMLKVLRKLTAEPLPVATQPPALAMPFPMSAPAPLARPPAVAPPTPRVPLPARRPLTETAEGLSVKFLCAKTSEIFTGDYEKHLGLWYRTATYRIGPAFGPGSGK